MDVRGRGISADHEGTTYGWDACSRKTRRRRRPWILCWRGYPCRTERREQRLGPFWRTSGGGKREGERGGRWGKGARQMGRYLSKPSPISQRRGRVLSNTRSAKSGVGFREKNPGHVVTTSPILTRGFWSEIAVNGAIRNHSSHCSKVGPSHPLPSFTPSNVGQKSDF